MLYENFILILNRVHGDAQVTMNFRTFIFNFLINKKQNQE